VAGVCSEGRVRLYLGKVPGIKLELAGCYVGNEALAAVRQ
jgi:hypothetical protein